MAAVSLLRQGESEYLFFFILGDGGVVVAIYFQTDLFISCKKKKTNQKTWFLSGPLRCCQEHEATKVAY